MTTKRFQPMLPFFLCGLTKYGRFTAAPPARPTQRQRQTQYAAGKFQPWWPKWPNNCSTTALAKIPNLEKHQHDNDERLDSNMGLEWESRALVVLLILGAIVAVAFMFLRRRYRTADARTHHDTGKTLLQVEF